MGKNQVKVLRQSTLLLFILASVAIAAVAQNKQLTIDDIFDPVKKVNFSGTLPDIRWLKDGKHYLLTNEASNKSVPRLQKVNALTGEATPLFDVARMEAAFNAFRYGKKDTSNEGFTIVWSLEDCDFLAETGAVMRLD